MSEFVTYEKFATIGELKEFVELLQENNIPYELEDDIQLLDASFANPNHHRDYRIKLQQADFESVNELRNSIALLELDRVDPDYYLFDFTDEELIDLISKQDEWSPFDFQLARKILKDRGKEIGSQQMDELKNSRIKELATVEKHSIGGIVSGYILTAFGGVLSFVIYGYISTLLVLIGLIIGGYIVSSKKTLPNGERIYTYDDSDRKQGKIILIIGAPMLIISVLIRLWGTLEFLSSF
ncbi:hypothetical protein [uncultured Fluviicola sp.]|uniref:hypothetical protein n=1 Tax=uncultured Fluviicola sp. TaxID=463303 RepID=UPI0025DCA772|nr:hypothetical protein [uncultured Fluviicola sp.]